MNHVAEVPGEDRDYVNLELPYNTGRVFLLTSNHCSIDTIKSVAGFIFCSDCSE